MNLYVLFSFVSAAVAALFVFTAPFNKKRSLPLWSFSLGMLCLAIEQLLSGFALQTNNPLEISKYTSWKFFATATLPGLWLLFASTYSRGNIKESLKKRAGLIIASFALPWVLVTFGKYEVASLIPDTEQPFSWKVSLGVSGFIIHLVLLMSMIASLVGIERTYRASVGTMRWKIKFMLYGLGTLFAARFFTSSQIILDREIDPGLETINAVALFVCCLLVGRSVFRKGSFEIDLYPSQSIISGSLVISLAGAYLIIVGLLSKIVSRFGGDQAFAIQTFLILVALVGLALFIQSDRARQIVRRFVSRNFNRPLFDYRTLWLKVAAAASESVREKDICESMTKLLVRLFDTKLTSIWLKSPSSHSYRLVATSDPLPEDQEPLVITASGISVDLVEHPDPHIIEFEKAEWAEAIRTANPTKFKDGGNRILIPLVGQAHAVGFIVMGDRTNTLKFTQQEFDTLRCIGDHIAATLLSAALTRKLEESKEIEAFQTMATFFVHDLKNAVSTLNLMLKNMPLHWDNPEFRQDALRGLGNTSTRISDLINRLSQVRHELDLNKMTLEFREIVQVALSEWEVPSGINFTSEVQTSAQINADPKKLKSVILNLVINAAEAMEGTGNIALSLVEEGNEIVLKVEDDGPGMDSEFIRNSLFRPFKTTKKSGLGIGMFQSKMVVEAHDGSITVESTPGKSTLFTLRFPVES